jgi:2'-5' RNA ligase
MATDHFKKHARKSPVDWNFNVLFHSQPAIDKMRQQYASVIKDAELYDPIPTPWLHATILRVGLLEEYTEAEMLTVADKLQTSLAGLKLPTFSFDSWWLWGGNVGLHISPGDEFGQIYQHTAAALESVVGSQRATKTPHGGFIPHTSMAYTKDHTAEQDRELHQKLVANPVQPASFEVKNLSLIKQWPKDGHYEWEIIREIPIG